MTVKTQLKETINNTSEKTLFEKLNKYFSYDLTDPKSLADEIFNDVNKLEELKSLIQELQPLTGHYEFDVLYNNDQDFWNEKFESPSEAIELVSVYYDINDEYVFINGGTGSVESCSNLAGFYKSSIISGLTEQIAKDLKKDTTETIDNLNSDNQEVLFKILNN